MEEQKRFQEFKLTNCIVSTSCSLLTFFTKNSHTNMSSQNHSYIVRTISDCKSCQMWFVTTNQPNNICLLLWRYSTCQNYVDIVRNFQELFFQALVFINNDKWCSSDHKSLPLLSLFITLTFILFNLSSDFTESIM